MYSVILMTALTAGSATPDWFRYGSNAGYYGGMYAPYCGSYYCYGCHEAYGSYGGNFQHGFYQHGCGGCHNISWTHGCVGNEHGCYGHGYGYHGYGYDGPIVCSGCYGCHGGYSGYGMPIPQQDMPRSDYGQPYPQGGMPVAPPMGTPVPKGDRPAEELIKPQEKKIDGPKSESQSRVKVRIEVPVGAALFVDGQRINVAAGTRVFQTPPIARGQQYFYDLRVETVRNGQILSEDRRVIIELGHEALVSFPNLTPQGSQFARR